MPVEAKIHLLERQREVELLLRLRQRVRVRGRFPRPDPLGDVQVLGELVDLRLVEVRDRLHVSGAVAELDEESLVVLEPVRRADDRVVERVGVEVLEHLPRPLLEVRGGHDRQVLVRREPRLDGLALRRLGHEREQTVRVGSEHRREDDLEQPALAELRNHPADGLVAPLVAARGAQDLGDVLDDGLDAERIGDQAADLEGLIVRVRLRHQHRQRPLGPEILRRQNGGCSARTGPHMSTTSVGIPNRQGGFGTAGPVG